MLEIRELSADTLQATVLNVHTVTASTVNGISPAELLCLKGSTENIQTRLTNIVARATNLVKGWQ